MLVLGLMVSAFMRMGWKLRSLALAMEGLGENLSLSVLPAVLW